MSSKLSIAFIGLDSSHCTAFTDLLQAENDPIFAYAAVTVGWPGGSPDFPMSRDRVEGFTSEMRDRRVRIAESPEDAASSADAIILGCVDGRQHLEIARRLMPFQKPMFVDKPLAHDFATARQLAKELDAAGVPWFSSSALRFQEPLPTLLSDPDRGAILGCDVHGIWRHGPGHSDLAWYGIHGIEALFTVMGPGCQRVQRVSAENGDVVIGQWTGGRIGTWRGLKFDHQATGYGLTVFCRHAIHQSPVPADYDGLVREIVRFFQTLKPPVSSSETLEIFAFMDAAERSRDLGGQVVPVEIG
ncbi:MAG: hypothetical protein JNM43_16560 [Planctomycetaceae bacterium]|nr:hypothetical protein [Planctomycetaceae bacterium]